MKKLFYVLFASASLSFVACNTGGEKSEAVDSTEVSNMVDEATKAVDSMANATVDTANKAMEAAADTAKKHM